MTKTSLYSLIFLSSTLLGMTDAVASLKISQTATPTVISSLADKKLLTDITSVGSRLFSLGERGHIIYSENGTDWTQAKVPVNVLLTSISFSSEKTGFAVGHDATILKTTDGGESWTLLNYQPELDRPLLAVKSFGNEVVAVGAYGLFWQSKDSGNTWTQEFHDELLFKEDREFLLEIKDSDPELYEIEKQYLLPHFNDVYLSGDNWYLAGEAGFVAQSSNQGNDWEKLDVDYYGSFFSLTKNEQENLVVAGLRGNVFEESSDAWQAFSMDGKATINDILVYKETVFLFANSGNLYFSANGEDFKHYVFDDGKAVMSGVVKNSNLVLATEAGIKFIPLATLK